MGAASNFVAAKFTAIAPTLGEKKAKCQAEHAAPVRSCATTDIFGTNDIQMLLNGLRSTASVNSSYRQYSIEQSRTFSYAGLAFPVLILLLLLYYRSRFQEACKA